MPSSLTFWAAEYHHLKEQALCVDIESAGRHGPITVVGVHKPVSLGVAECRQFVRGRDLTAENLAAAFEGAKALITYRPLAPETRTSGRPDPAFAIDGLRRTGPSLSARL